MIDVGVGIGQTESMMRNPNPAPLWLSALILLAALLSGATAQPLAPPLHLREGEAPVDSQSAEDRRQAARLALVQVLVRMSGNSAVADDPTVRRSLDQAERLMQHFSYRQEVVTETGEAPRRQLYLVARFDPEGVDGILESAGVRLWLSKRPTTLLLVELDEGESRRLIGEDDAAAVDPFQRRARLLALPLVLPLLDLEEQIRLTPQALGAGLRDVLGDMGKRYDAPAVLHGQLTRVADFWVARWTLLVEGRTERWESTGALRSVLLSGADGLGDALGRRYALSAAERLGGSYRIWISGLRAPADYPRLMRYLADNPLVRDVVAELADGDSLLLRLNAGATLERLLQSLTVGFILANDPTTERDPVGAAAPADARLLLLP